MAHEAQLKREEDDAREAAEQAEALIQASKGDSSRLQSCEDFLRVAEDTLVLLDQGVEEARASYDGACSARAAGQQDLDRAQAAMSQCRLDLSAKEVGPLDAALKELVESGGRAKTLVEEAAVALALLVLAYVDYICVSI